MLDVVFYRDRRDRPSSVIARGHAEYAVDADDLVCAAVSAVLQAARLGLEEFAGIELDARQQSGDFHIRWPEAVRDDARLRAIVGTAELAVAQIARQYPEHVTCNTARETG